MGQFIGLKLWVHSSHRDLSTVIVGIGVVDGERSLAGRVRKDMYIVFRCTKHVSESCIACII
jgi:hypothetical protein